MIGSTLGDLSQSYTSRQRNVALRQDIGRYTQELSTGQVSDPRQVMAGNYSYLTDIERKMDMLKGYGVATAEATQYSSVMQTVIGDISNATQDLANSLITASITAIGPANADISNEAFNALDEIVGRLNTETAGRFLFSGTATDRPPLANTSTLLNAARTALAGAATPGDMIAAANVWFDDPAGFEAAVYQGSDDALAPFSLSVGDAVSLDVRATDPELRQMLKLTTLAALANDPAFALNSTQKTELFIETGKEMLAARDNIVNLAGRVGFAEARIAAITARNAAEQTSLSFAKADLLSVDLFEAATRLEEVQFQLQSLYSVTARNAQLSLVNFI
jgi:flagellar hook-associated protein 3 FlgL